MRPLALLAVQFVAATGGGSASDLDRTMEFAAEMAERGNWREARYRWETVLDRRPDEAKVLNNLAVAAEALGERGLATELYAKASAIVPGDPWIARNATAARRFQEIADGEHGVSAEGDWGGVAIGEADRKEMKKADVIEIPVRLPLPPKLRLAGVNTLLVASFLASGDEMLDANREIVRFLRSEFRKRGALEVLEVTPPPPVPEQTLEDMARNNSFWKFLANDHGADLVVSGVLEYDRRDASGFREVDRVSPTTGQKVKTSQFVEQQEFEFEMVVLFFRGLDGTLLYRDRFRRESVYSGTANDPISAFYDLAGRIAEDITSVIAPTFRSEPRAIFAE
jgi:hypothetical protein